MQLEKRSLKKIHGFNGIRTRDLREYRCDALPTELRSHTVGSQVILVDFVYFLYGKDRTYMQKLPGSQHVTAPSSSFNSLKATYERLTDQHVSARIPTNNNNIRWLTAGATLSLETTLIVTQQCSFIAQLVEHRTGIRRGYGFESRSVKPWIF